MTSAAMAAAAPRTVSLSTTPAVRVTTRRSRSHGVVVPTVMPADRKRPAAESGNALPKISPRAVPSIPAKRTITTRCQNCRPERAT